MNDSETRARCKEKIEALEHWLRRLIDDSLTPAYGDFFEFSDSHGNRLLRKHLVDLVNARRAQEPTRYPRKIDAVLLDDAIDIICKPDLYKRHFAPALNAAFPYGAEEARTFLRRILEPRNNLAHANPISSRQAERILCYSNDIIDSLKEYYRVQGMHKDYNDPLILKIADSFGQVFTRSQCGPCHDGGIMVNCMDDSRFFIRPGDTLSIEIEIDPSFDVTSYTVSWSSTKAWSPTPVIGPRIEIPISNRQVGNQFDIQCRIVSNQDWHRMHMGVDDFLMLYYKVLPPIP